MIFIGGFYEDGRLGVMVFDKQPGCSPRFKEGFTLTSSTCPYHSAQHRLRELYNKYLLYCAVVEGLSERSWGWLSPYLENYSDEVLRSYIAGVIGMPATGDLLGVDIYQAKGALLALAAMHKVEKETFGEG